MAINFPNSPNLNDIYVVDNITYVWNGVAWTTATMTDTILNVITSDTPPAGSPGPLDGDVWWNSADGRLYVYYDDGDSQQWVVTTPTTTGAQGLVGSQGIQGTAGSGTQGVQGIQGTLGIVDSGVDVSNSTTQSIPNTAVVTPVTFDTENRDDSNYWSSGSIVTIPTAGWYIITGQFAWGIDSAGTRRIYITKNQNTAQPLMVELEIPAASVTVHQTISGAFYFAANDQVELCAALSGAAGAVLISGARMTVNRLGAGATGIQGIQGTQGIQGNLGTQGIQGLDGAYAAQGVQGTQGIQGLQSVQGLQGIQGIAGGNGVVSQNIQNTSYVLVLGDAGKTIFKENTGAGVTITIPSNVSVPFDVGTVVSFINDDPNAMTIAINADTLILAGDGTVGSRTLVRYGIATATKITSTRWLISGAGLS